jgi:hypothetical protein
MRRECVGASTYRDSHGDRFAPESFDRVANDINTGASCPAFGVEHDRTLPPLGKVIAARIEDLPDGERLLVLTQDLFENERQITLPDGTVGFVSESDSDRRPFVQTIKPVDVTHVQIDRVNLEDPDEADQFFSDVRSATSEPFEEGAFFRKAAVPDPELVIVAAKTIAAALVGKKVVDKVVDSIGDKVKGDLAKLYDLARAAVVNFAKRAVPRNRPHTYLVVIPGDPVIELVAVTTLPDAFLEALTEAHLKEAVERALELHSRFDTARVQMLLAKDGTWRFNYLVTHQGTVIGTDESLRRRTKVLQILLEKTQTDPGDKTPSA